MATIRYRIEGGLSPFEVQLYNGAILIDTNYHGAIEDYYFTNLPDGIYIIRIIDATGCFIEFESVVDCETTTTTTTFDEIGVLTGDTNGASSWDNGDADFFAQSFDVCGEIKEISIVICNDHYLFGGTGADFKLRAKLYYDVPNHGDGDFPLGDYIGQSTNTIDITTVSDCPETEIVTFYFDGITVNREFICVFEYEDVVDHGDAGTGCMGIRYIYDGTPYEKYMIYIGDLGFWANKSIEYPPHQLLIQLKYIEQTCLSTTTTTTCALPEGVIEGDTVISVKLESPTEGVIIGETYEDILEQVCYILQNEGRIESVNTIPNYGLIDGDDIYVYDQNGCCMADGFHVMDGGGGFMIFQIEDCKVVGFFDPLDICTTTTTTTLPI